MKRTIQFVILLALLTTTSAAPAVPINGIFTNDPTHCDNPLDQSFGHELGDMSVFPTVEAIDFLVLATTDTVCTSDGIANDWLVVMRNVSGLSYANLHFVADAGIGVGNKDGTALDTSVTSAPGDAFRIDGTVTVTGVNDNLIAEVGGTVDEIFEPGEVWEFLVTDFLAFDAVGAVAPPNFTSVGVFAGTSALIAGSNASILATLVDDGNVVPEPSTLVLAALGFLGFLVCRRRPAVLLVLVFSSLVQPLWAGTIIGYGGASGPGLGSVVTPTFSPSPVVNDNVVGASPNALIISEKRFGNVGIIDMEFGVTEELPPGSTVSEYQVREFIFNDTGVTWGGHTVQLGYGVGAGFVLSTPGDGLDFDSPEVDSIFSFGPFTSPSIGPDALAMTGGTVPAAGFFVLEFALDVPNIPGSHKFTIRQLVIAASVVPEPSSLVLSSIGLFSIAGFGWRRRAARAARHESHQR